MATHPGGLRELSLFSGAGGGLLATQHLLGWRAVCYVERDPYCVDVLKQRMADGLLHDAPIWDDCRTFDGKPWRGLVDVISAGFPCQPFSVAGASKADADDRNGWPWVARIVREVGPRYVFLENVPGLLAASHGYFGTVLGDLAESGYDVRWACLSAAQCGAPHLRKRLWVRACLRVPDASGDGVWVKRERDGGQRDKPRPPVSGDDGEEKQLADAAGQERPGLPSRAQAKHTEFRSPGDHGEEKQLADAESVGRRKGRARGSARVNPGLSDTARDLADAESVKGWNFPEDVSNGSRRRGRGIIGPSSDGGAWWTVEPALGRVAHGVADRVDRLKALGNGQVPAVAAAAWRRLNQPEKETRT